MKKIITNTVLAGTMLLIPLSVFATTTPLRDAVKQKTQIASTTSSSTKERIVNKIDSRRETLRKIAQNKIEHVIRRLEATIQRLSTIMSKIISRIEKVKIQGGDTTNAEKYITEAKMHIDEAKTALTTLKNASSSADTLVNNSVDSQSTTTSPVRTGLKKLKDMIVAVEKHIREAHKSLLNSAKALRGASSAQHATSTSSISTTTNNNQQNNY